MRQIVRKRILEKCCNKCVQCSSIKNLEIDHVIPLSKGGRHDEINMQILCRPCNRKKSNLTDYSEFFKEGERKEYLLVRKNFIEVLRSVDSKELKFLLEVKFNELCQEKVG